MPDYATGSNAELLDYGANEKQPCHGHMPMLHMTSK